MPTQGRLHHSDTGREVTRALDPWPHSEAGRFHRGIAIAIVGFGALVVCAAAGLHHGAADVAVLATALAICGGVGLYLLADLHSSPSGFPSPEGQLSGTPLSQSRRA